MITSLAQRIANFLFKNNAIDEKKIDIYIYGFEIIISSCINIIIATILGILFSQLIECLIFLLSFIFLRKYCGGYHANTYSKCNIIFTIITASVMLVSSMSISVSAYESSQKLVESNTYTDEYGYIVNEYIWEDATSEGISAYSISIKDVTDAEWIETGDELTTGKHRSAKEYGESTDGYWCWRAAAQTELYSICDNSQKYHYTRARVINPWVFWEDIRADSDRVWGYGRTTARTDGYKFDEDFALRSYWGY